MKVKYMGNVMQVKSDLTQEMIEKTEIHFPNALKLFDEEKNEIFAIGFGSPSITKYGVSFSDVDDEGFIYLTASCKEEFKKETIAEVFAGPLTKLQTVEEKVKVAFAQIETLEKEVMEHIEEA